MKYKKIKKSNIKTLRLCDSVNNSLKYVAKKKNISETDFMRNVIQDTLNKELLDIALDSYKKGKISISTAADICNLSKRDFLFKLEDNNISYINSNKKDLAKSIKDLKKEILKK